MKTSLTLITFGLMLHTGSAYSARTAHELNYSLDSQGRAVVTYNSSATTPKDLAEADAFADTLVSLLHINNTEDQAKALFESFESFRFKANFQLRPTKISTSDDINYEVCIKLDEKAYDACASVGGFFDEEDDQIKLNEILKNSLSKKKIIKNTALATPPKKGPTVPPKVKEYERWVQKQINGICGTSNCYYGDTLVIFNTNYNMWEVRGLYMSKDGSMDHEFHIAYFD